jgi:hypothetical protein
VTRALPSIALAALVGCGAVRGPELDPEEHVRGEHQRVLQEPMDRLWPALLDALPGEGLEVAHADRGRGAIATDPVRLSGRDVPKRLAEIGDLGRARSAGLQRVSELQVTYYLLLSPRGEAGTSLRIRSAIDAIDRSDAILLGSGVMQVVPRHFEVPSRGVVERDLMRRLVAGLFTAEETLFLLGEPGVD